jgi:hypothetical protein
MEVRLQQLLLLLGEIPARFPSYTLEHCFEILNSFLTGCDSIAAIIII